MNKKFLKIFAQAVLLAIILAGAFFTARFAQESEQVRALVAEYGYFGIFLVSAISGFNLAVPIPAIAFLPLFMESGLSFWPVVWFIVAGLTLADLVAYYLGRVGHQALAHSNSRFLLVLQKTRKRFRWAPIVILFFFASFVPLPNEILLVPLGFLGYRLAYVFPVVFSGHLVFNTLYGTGIINLYEFL